MSKDPLFEEPKAQTSEPEEDSKVTVDISFRHVPRSLRNAFKAQCSLDGMPMQEKIISMMRNYVRFGQKQKAKQNGR